MGAGSASPGAAPGCCAGAALLANRAEELARLMHARERQADGRRDRRDRSRRSTTSTGRPATPSGCWARAGCAPAWCSPEHAAHLEYQPLRRGRRDRPVELPGAHPDGLDRRTRWPPATPWSSSPASTPRRSGQWLVDRFAEVVPEQPVLQVVHGLGETGAALCRAGVDKIAFTGSTATGKKVMAACAETLTPVLIECGGKDAMIVDADADLDAAADAASGAALTNAGQTCIGIERVYVVDAGLRRVRRQAGRAGRRS